MKKCIGTAVIILLTFNYLNAQHQEFKELQPFTDVVVEGNIRLFLEQGEETAMIVKARKAWQIEEYQIGVRGKTLYVKQVDDWNDRTPKISIYLKHTGIEYLEAEGFVRIRTENSIEGKQLTLKGDGFIKGSLEVEVDKLRVELDGLCNLGIAGLAGSADLQLDGMGRIKAEELLADDVTTSAEGLAGIRIGN